MLKFKKEDYCAIQRASQGDRYVPLSEAEVLTLEAREHSYTVKIDDRIVAIAGLLVFWPGRAEAWATIDTLCRREFLALHNVVKRFLDVVPYQRIEAAVCESFAAGHRWAKLLGFQVEASRLKNYCQGQDFVLYARTK